MISDAIPLVELNTLAIRILCREIGPVNTARFLNQYTSGFGNYTEERDEFFGHLALDEIVADIRQRSPPEAPR